MRIYQLSYYLEFIKNFLKMITFIFFQIKKMLLFVDFLPHSLIPHLDQSHPLLSPYHGGLGMFGVMWLYQPRRHTCVQCVNLDNLFKTEFWEKKSCFQHRPSVSSVLFFRGIRYACSQGLSLPQPQVPQAVLVDLDTEGKKGVDTVEEGRNQKQ